MKGNKTARRWLRKRTRAVKGGLAKLVSITGDGGSKRDLPQTSAVSQPGNNDSGILRQDVAAFRLPNALAEAGEREHRHWMPSGFVFLIIGLAIVFIAIVAWHVAQMPPSK
ncbi:MAG: hypothetical protein JST85_18695 [Acidobacteria bacterium]|nr:hypothetical protein [Acidobacteriota bacterium]